MRGANFSRFEVRATGRTDRRFVIQKRRASRLTSILDEYGYDYELTPMF